LGEEFRLVGDKLDIGEIEFDLVYFAKDGGDGISEVVGEGEIGEVKLGGVGVLLILLLQQLRLQPIELSFVALALDHSEPQ
jgi:hypothetical protein